MGTWDPKSFDNDTALDWVYDFEEDTTKNFLKRTLQSIQDHADELDASECEEAIAAAEVIVALHTNNFTRLPEDLANTVEKIDDSKVNDLFSLAIQALDLIETNSELRDLWEETESDDYKKWLENLDYIRKQLHA